MRILALLFIIIFFPIKTFAISLGECQMEYDACNSAGGSDCNGWERIKSQCENSFGRILFPENSGLGALPTIRVDAQWTDPFSYEIYYPKFGDWVSNGGSGSSGFGQFTGSASTQTQCQTDTTINPIVIANGKKIQQELDFTTTGEMPLAFIRYYDSFAKGAADFSVNGKWRHSFDYR